MQKKSAAVFSCFYGYHTDLGSEAPSSSSQEESILVWLQCILLLFVAPVHWFNEGSCASPVVWECCFWIQLGSCSMVVVAHSWDYSTVFLALVLLTYSTRPSQRSKYSEGVALRMLRCVAIQRLSRKCVQKKCDPATQEKAGLGSQQLELSCIYLMDI